MKRLFVLLALLPFASNAQLLLGGKNIIKTNLSSIAANNYHFTYERHIFKPLSVSLSYRFMPNTKVPLQSYVEKFLDNPNVNVGQFYMSGNAITPEVRLYLGLGRMKGFYISGYYRMSTFDVSVPVNYSYLGITKPAQVSGTIKGNSGGLMIGIQKNIAKILVLDLWILGGHYGSSTGDINAPLSASDAEKNALIGELQKIQTKPFEFTYTRTATGVNGASTGPWAGIRGAGICLGVRF